MMDTGRFVITNECVMLNKGFQCMLFINNINVMIFYVDYLFSYHIKLDEVCDYVLYLGFINLLLSIMVSFNSPMTLSEGSTPLDQRIRSPKHPHA